MSVQANIRRVKVDSADDYQTLFNKNTGDMLRIPRGRDVALQFGLFEKGIWIPTPSFLGVITVEIKPFTDRTAAALVTANTSIISTVSVNEWEANTNQHFTVTLPAAQTASLASADETPYWMVVTALTTGACPLTLISGKVIGINDGGNYSATTPAPGSAGYVTMEQFFAVLAAQQNGLVSNGKRLSFVYETDGTWTQNTTDA